MQGFDPDLMERYLAIARRLDARIIRVALDATEAAADQAKLAAALRGAAEAASGAGARVAVENHFGFPSAQLVALLEAVDHPAIGVCLDVGNSICGGEWPEKTIRLLAPWTINLHLKDWDILPDPYGVGFRIHGTPFGEGRTDAGAVLRALKSRPPMSVIYEHWLPWPGDFDAARAQEQDWTARGLAAFRALLGKDDRAQTSR
jgi:sugar phosphate isomerase/epimerase